MTEECNKGGIHLLFCWDGVPIGMAVLLNAVGKGIRKGYRVSRIVVLPDYQGLGFGSQIMEFLGGVVASIGGTLYIKTVHDKMGRYLARSPKWSPTSYNGKQRKNVEDPRYSNRLSRVSHCYKYCGDTVEGYEYLLSRLKFLLHPLSSVLQ